MSGRYGIASATAAITVLFAAIVFAASRIDAANTSVSGESPTYQVIAVGAITLLATGFWLLATRVLKMLDRHDRKITQLCDKVGIDPD